MNTNMKLIAEQALTYAYEICRKENRPGGDGDHIWVSLVMGKLSELIINECLIQVRDEVQYISDWDKADKVVGAVKKHFGVE